jgi:2'-hydroxyisoflavone reductase
VFGQNVTEHNPAPSPCGHRLLSGPPTLNDIHQIFTITAPNFLAAMHNSTAKPRVLVIGGTQFMGRATVAALLQNGGYDLTILNRGRTESPFEGLVRHVVCNRRKRALGEFIASEPAWHAVVDFVAFGPDDVRRIVPQHVDKLGLYILISTDSVYMASSATGFVHGPSGRLTEQSDAQPDAARAALDEYGANKRDLEHLLAQHGRCSTLRCLCLRLPDVLGRHENTGRQHALIKRLVGGALASALASALTLALALPEPEPEP